MIVFQSSPSLLKLLFDGEVSIDTVFGVERRIAAVDILGNRYSLSRDEYGYLIAQAIAGHSKPVKCQILQTFINPEYMK